MKIMGVDINEENIKIYSNRIMEIFRIHKQNQKKIAEKNEEDNKSENKTKDTAQQTNTDQKPTVTTIKKYEETNLNSKPSSDI